MVQNKNCDCSMWSEWHKIKVEIRKKLTIATAEENHEKKHQKKTEKKQGTGVHIFIDSVRI